LVDAAAAILRNPQAKWRAFLNASHHYDIGDDLYQRMLGKWMVYSCAYWKGASQLDQAQEHKMELICKKIGLDKGMLVLDIGCGWGVLAKYMATKFKVNVVGITVSKNQFRFAKKLCEKLPVTIQLQDYRDLQGKFDRVVSVGMFEHVGFKNYSQYMKVASRVLKEDGLFLLQTIGNNQSHKQIDPWIQKYIFPNAMLPSVQQIGKAIEGNLLMEDWHNFGPDYDKTLMAWFSNFKRNWPKISKKYGERFFRMWKFYLLSCAGAFRSRDIQLWQVLLSKSGAHVAYLRK
jgi:cyclopropane-fatty-acyl-phospholipid synthase